MGKIPKLRFKEFSGVWEEKKLGDITKINQGLQIPISDRFMEQVENSFFYITNEFLKENSQKKYFIRNPSQSVLCDENDILMTRTGNTGQVVTNVNGAFHNNFFKIKYDDCISKNYLVYFLRSTKIQNKILSLAGTSTIPDLNHGDFYKIKIHLPSKPEQQKIASFLTSVDTKIEQLTKKKTLLEEYKKGMMQKLFSQELRFKADGGSEFPEWGEKKLGEVCEIIMGQSPSSNSYNSDNNGVPLIQGNADIQNRLSNPRNYTTEKTKECKIGDLILTVRAPVGAIAKSIHNACIGRGVCAIRNNTKSTNEFIYQFLLDYETKWSSLEQGSTFTAVSGIEIKKLKIKLPCIDEQTKIANLLSSIDKKIELISQEIKKAKEFKQGLLQQMFV